MDRRSRGTRWSSSCFQICAALGFLVFMVRSREEVDSRQLTVHRQKKGQDLTQRTQRSEKREFDGPDRVEIIDRRRKKIGARFIAPLQGNRRTETDYPQKEKG